MIAFIFVVMVVSLILLIISIVAKIYTLGLISAMGMIVIGVYILGTGIEEISNLLTMGLGIIYISTGIYVLISGSLEKIEEM